MEKKVGYYIFGGLLTGALLGSIWTAGDNPLMGEGIGWFIAAAVFEQKKKEK